MASESLGSFIVRSIGPYPLRYIPCMIRFSQIDENWHLRVQRDLCTAQPVAPSEPSWKRLAPMRGEPVGFALAQRLISWSWSRSRAILLLFVLYK